MLHETVDAPQADATHWAPQASVLSNAGPRRAFNGLLAIALPAVCVFAAATAVVLARGGNPQGLLTAAILAAVYVGGIEVVARSTWLSPLALGIPITAALGIMLAIPVISLLDFWVPGFDVSAGELALAALTTFGVWSLYWASPAARMRKRRRRVLVVGRAGGGLKLVDELAARPDLPFECLGLVDDDTGEGESRLGDLGHLKETVIRERIDIVVFADASLRDVAMPSLLDVGSLDLRVVGLADFYEHAFGRVPVDNLSQTWFMSLMYLYRGGYPQRIKRMLDVGIALLALLLTAALFPLIALAIVIESRGSVFFRQMRVGEGGQLFEILKFRTMIDGAEDPGRAMWAQKNDDRITRVGKVLRNARLDELPQLWNVLRGDMSLVGPRPERPEFLELLEDRVPHWSRRLLVKPGITGWAQVCCGYTSDAASALDKLSYDLYYIKHRSPILDFAVAAKTATIILSGSGAK